MRGPARPSTAAASNGADRSPSPAAKPVDGGLESRQNAPGKTMGQVIAFRRDPEMPENRRGEDRRRAPRGGRRASDARGYAPLVLLIDADRDSNARCEAILARLHFAVAPARDVDEAKRVMEALRPTLVVARIADAAALKQLTGADTPLVLLADDLLDPEALIDAIRRELRRRS